MLLTLGVTYQVPLLLEKRIRKSPSEGDGPVLGVSVSRRLGRDGAEELAKWGDGLCWYRIVALFPSLFVLLLRPVNLKTNTQTKLIRGICLSRACTVIRQKNLRIIYGVHFKRTKVKIILFVLQLTRQIMFTFGFE